VYRQHGLSGFMRGWTANYARLGPQTVVTFLCAEKLRHLMGLKSL
jgi:solute carrier family 25 uncoupling protein 8/9